MKLFHNPHNGFTGNPAMFSAMQQQQQLGAAQMQQQGCGMMPGMMMMGPQAMFQDNPGAGNITGGGNPKSDDKPQPKGIFNA